MILISIFKSIVKEYIITENGIICLEKNLINDYIYGYVVFRFVEIIASEIFMNVNMRFW